MSAINYTRSEYEAALATIPEETKAKLHHYWIWRVHTWELAQEMGELVASLLWDLKKMGDVSQPRNLAPEFYDWFLSVYPDPGNSPIIEYNE